MEPVKSVVVGCCRRNREREKVMERRTENFRTAAGKKSRESIEEVKKPVRGSKESGEEVKKPGKGSKESDKLSRLRPKFSKNLFDKRPQLRLKESKKDKKSKLSKEEKKPKSKEDISSDDTASEDGADRKGHVKKKAEKKKNTKNSKSGEAIVQPAGGRADGAGLPFAPKISALLGRKGADHQGSRRIKTKDPIRAKAPVVEAAKVAQDKAVVQDKPAKEGPEESFVDYWVQPGGKKAAQEQAKPAPRAEGEAFKPAGIELSVVEEPAMNPTPDAPKQTIPQSPPEEQDVLRPSKELLKEGTLKLGTTQSTKSRQPSGQMSPNPKGARMVSFFG
ncbi:hypothetical protein COOONC_23671 [Cooperia oncophora]